MMKGINMRGSKNTANSMLKRFLWGLGATILTYVVVPKMRSMAKPVVEKGVSSVKELAERGKQTMEEYRAQKNNADDMVKDASFENIPERDKVMSRVFILDRLNELQDTIDRLKREIMDLKRRLF